MLPKPKWDGTDLLACGEAGAPAPLAPHGAAITKDAPLETTYLSPASTWDVLLYREPKAGFAETDGVTAEARLPLAGRRPP